MAAPSPSDEEHPWRVGGKPKDEIGQNFPWNGVPVGRCIRPTLEAVGITRR
jgi:hypothetical protein